MCRLCFSHSNFWFPTPAAATHHVTGDVQIRRDHHAVDRFDGSQSQGCNHRRNTSHVSHNQRRGKTVQAPTLRLPVRRNVTVGRARPFRPFLYAAPTAAGQKHTRARAHRARRSTVVLQRRVEEPAPVRPRRSGDNGRQQRALLGSR